MEVIAAIETTATVIQAIVTIAENGEKLVSFVEKAVKEVETLSQENIVDKDSKFDVVMSYTEAFVEVLGENWSTLEDKIKTLINDFVTMFNDLGWSTSEED